MSMHMCARRYVCVCVCKNACVPVRGYACMGMRSRRYDVTALVDYAAYA